MDRKMKKHSDEFKARIALVMMRHGGHIVWWSLLAGWLLCVSGAWGANYYWDDDSGDHLWANSNNWSGNTKPGSADAAIFNDSKVGTNIVAANFLVNSVYYTNTVGVFYLQFTNSAILTSRYYYVGYNANISEVRVSGAGTLAFTAGQQGILYVGRRASAGTLVSGILTVSGAVFNTDNLFDLSVCYDFQSTGYNTTGRLDLSQATIVSQGQTNSLRVGSTSDTAGGLWVSHNVGKGTLLLPPTLTNILVQGTLNLGANSASDPSLLDLGTQPQLKQLTVTRSVVVANCDVVYNNGSTIVTGLPPNIQITLGQTNAPADLYLGYSTAATRTNSWQGFQRFESYISNLSLGTPGGANNNDIVGELDFTATNTTELVGSITFSNVALYQMSLGYDLRAEGRLKLPPTVQTISMNSLYLGSTKNVVGYSFIDLGTNSQLQTLIVTNQLQMGKGRFQYWDAGGCHTGLPASVRVQIGESSANRGALIVGKTALSASFVENTVTELSRMGAMQAYLNELTVGSGILSNYTSTGILDMRGCTNFSMDIDGAVNIGTNKGGIGYVYMPAGQVRAKQLNVGAAGAAATNNNLEGYLWMSNTVFTVTEGVALGDPRDTNSPGIVSNCLYGTSCGIDLQTNILTVTNGGRMVLNFIAEAADSKHIYWGFRMSGDQQTLLQAMTNGSPAPLTYDLSGLSEDSRRRFGIHYDAMRNVTYVGVRPPRGAILSIR